MKLLSTPANSAGERDSVSCNISSRPPTAPMPRIAGGLMAYTWASGRRANAVALMRRTSSNDDSWPPLRSSQGRRTTNRVPPLLAMAPVRME